MEECKFQFKKPIAQYKNKKGDKTTISNANMTNEKAIEFLRTNPERIRLFSKYPKNWGELIEKEPKTEEELQAEQAAAAAEAAAKAANQNEGGQGSSTEETTKNVEDIDVVDAENLSPEEEAAKAAEEAAKAAAAAAEAGSDEAEMSDEEMSAKKAELMGKKVKEIKALYPDAVYKVGTKKVDFINDILGIKK